MPNHVDWFVAPTGVCGDGSLDSPFHDPWVAFRRAEPGDSIHVAAGTYFGRFDRSSWFIEIPGLTVLGGYLPDFSERTPWKTPSVFAAYAGYEYVRDSNLIAGRDNHSGLLLDGLCFDAAGCNEYSQDATGSIGKIPTMDGAIAAFSSPNVTIRNCMFTNGASGGVQLAGSGSRFENNLLVNLIGVSMLELRGSPQVSEQPIVVTNNAFCFMHDLGDPAGCGGDSSQGLRVWAPSVIDGNLFMCCGNSAIGVLLDADRVTIERNQFYATTHNVVTCNSTSFKGEIKEKNLEELEDIGFKSSSGNVVPSSAIKGWPGPWLDAVTRDICARYAKSPQLALNALRTANDLAALTAGDVDGNGQKGATAPRFVPQNAYLLVTETKIGAHSIAPPAVFTPRPTASKPEYQRIEFNAIATPQPSLANMRVELRVGFGKEQDTKLLADAPVETHMGVRVFAPGTDENSFFALIPRNSFASRQYRDSRSYQYGSEVERAYFLRGVYRTDTGDSRQKMTLVVEDIGGAVLHQPPIPVRPAGRDWFVRAGSSNGDGSRERPFRDPFQALEKCEGGDTIHVATGEYFGKLRTGKWLLNMRNLALLGGYDAEFNARDPWTFHTHFTLDAEEKAKGRPSDPIFCSDEVSDGLIVDGFIFDGAAWNTYKDGSLDLNKSPLAPLIHLRGVDAPLTVRNCLFANASANSVRLDCSLLVFENNVIVNTSGDALVVNSNGAGPALIRNNTILFSCDPTGRAGSGQSSSGGTLIQLTGRGEFMLESNIIGFADNYGMRAALPQDNITLTNNLFGANLFNHICDCKYLFADGSNWARRVENDSTYRLNGNRLEVSAWPVNRDFADLALSRLFCLHSRIGTQEWIDIASAIGAVARPAEEKRTEVAASPSSQLAPSLGGGTLDSLLASLSATTSKLREIETATLPPPAAPIYCPRYDWKSALAFFAKGVESDPGAHLRKLDSPLFGSMTAKPLVTYMQVKGAEFDELRNSLDRKPIELDLTQLRDSSTNPLLFAPDTNRTDYIAYSVEMVGTQTRTRIALIVRADTQVSRRMNKVQQSDKLHVRGTAYHTSGVSGLSIIVDSFELLGA